jgi:hypothetical protein
MCSNARYRYRHFLRLPSKTIEILSQWWHSHCHNRFISEEAISEISVRTLLARPAIRGWVVFAQRVWASNATVPAIVSDCELITMPSNSTTEPRSTELGMVHWKRLPEMRSSVLAQRHFITDLPPSLPGVRFVDIQHPILSLLGLSLARVRFCVLVVV